jgi:hypothetical protein
VCMTMPETSMNHNDRSMPRQDDIGPPGEARDMEAKATPETVEHGTNLAFGRGVPRADAGHVPTAAFPR